MTLTTRQKAYALARAKGMGQAQAAREAGYAAGSAKNAAAKLEKHAGVMAAIAAAKADQPPEQPARSLEFETAEAYLSAVVAGLARPDPCRVSAARALIQYEMPRQRRPLRPAVNPTQQEAKAKSAAEREQADDWAAKVAAVKRKLGIIT
jgi:hypothetical protein